MVSTTFDISEITDLLVNTLTTAYNTSPMWQQNGGSIPKFTLTISSSSPETVRTGQAGDCQLSLYLLHVAQNSYLRNTAIMGSGAMGNTQKPLALDLAYLLTAFAADNADREQQAMNIALSCFYEKPILSTDPVNPANGQQLTVTLGGDTLEEMSRLWQSFTVAYRLSAIFRVAVVLITPSNPPGTVSPTPKTINLAVAPSAALATTPQLFGVSRTVGLSNTRNNTDPNRVVAIATPLSTVAGATLRVGGLGLSGAAAAGVYLSTLDGATTWTITGWRTNGRLDSELVLNVPNTYAIPPAGAVPASAPTPGVYLLSVGGATPASRGPGIPLVITPRLDDVATPPLLTAVSDVYTLVGAGFTPSATQVYIGDTPLTPVTTPPTGGTGGFLVGANGTRILFSLPSGQPSGLTSVRVRVDGVDTPPAWQLVAP
jgi:hypothetical protein